MKQVLLFFAISLLALSCTTAQNDAQASPGLSDSPPAVLDSIYAERVVYEMDDIEQPPKYPGGEKEMLKHLAETLKLPPKYADTYSHITSTTITFVVEADGSITDKKVIRNDGPLAQSALQAIEQMPRWIPGLKNGQAVAVRFRLPIRIKLE